MIEMNAVGISGFDGLRSGETAVLPLRQFP
jgi:hypothetical protein